MCFSATGTHDFHKQISELPDDSYPSIIYTTPEAFGGFMGYLREKLDHVCLVAVDEVHCISEWGYDFRPEYRQLGSIRDSLSTPGNIIPLIGCTATATREIESDVIENLNFRRDQLEIVKTSLFRSNLHLRFFILFFSWNNFL